MYIILMKGIGMQINSINNVNFGARIVPSEYLNKAIYMAKYDYESGTAEGKKRASTFYNSLRTIESDGTKKELSINDSNKNLPPILNLDGTKFFIETYRDVENKTAAAVQDAVNLMAQAKYFRNEMKNEADKVNLSYAFDVWKK